MDSSPSFNNGYNNPILHCSPFLIPATLDNKSPLHAISPVNILVSNCLVLFIKTFIKHTHHSLVTFKKINHCSLLSNTLQIQISLFQSFYTWDIQIRVHTRSLDSLQHAIFGCYISCLFYIKK